MLRIDNIGGSNHLYSLVVDGDCQNGDIVQVGDLRPDGEAFDASTTITDVNGRIALVAQVPLDRTDDDLLLAEWDVKAGSMVRAYILEAGDNFTIGQHQIEGAHNKGDVLGVDAVTGKMKVGVTGTALQYVVHNKETVGGVPATYVEVL